MDPKIYLSRQVRSVEAALLRTVYASGDNHFTNGDTLATALNACASEIQRTTLLKLDETYRLFIRKSDGILRREDKISRRRVQQLFHLANIEFVSEEDEDNNDSTTLLTELVPERKKVPVQRASTRCVDDPRAVVPAPRSVSANVPTQAQAPACVPEPIKVPTIQVSNPPVKPVVKPTVALNGREVAVLLVICWVHRVLVTEYGWPEEVGVPSRLCQKAIGLYWKPWRSPAVLAQLHQKKTIKRSWWKLDESYLWMVVAELPREQGPQLTQEVQVMLRNDIHEYLYWRSHFITKQFPNVRVPASRYPTT